MARRTAYPNRKISETFRPARTLAEAPARGEVSTVEGPRDCRPKFTGRGLGLSAVLGIVRGHHGALEVSTSLGQGTAFKLLFPADAGVATKGASRASHGRRPLLGNGTILVVDDEEIVRRAATSALEHAGYTVLQAGNGREAMAVYEQQHGSIDLVVLDMTMPVMSGEETLLALRMRYPAVKVVLSSGYDEVEAIQRFADKGLAGFLQKPYAARTLLERVKTLLG